MTLLVISILKEGGSVKIPFSIYLKSLISEAPWACSSFVLAILQIKGGSIVLFTWWLACGDIRLPRPQLNTRVFYRYTLQAVKIQTFSEGENKL